MRRAGAGAKPAFLVYAAGEQVAGTDVPEWRSIANLKLDPPARAGAPDV